MRKKVLTIILGFFMFLGAFALTNKAFDEAGCWQDCPRINENGCPLVGCSYITVQGQQVLSCSYKAGNCWVNE
jgi:hypothetical protein